MTMHSVNSIKFRLIEIMKSWETERLMFELESYISQDTEENIEKYYFDDIASEEEHKQGKLFKIKKEENK